jgi:hypothetical protein
MLHAIVFLLHIDTNINLTFLLYDYCKSCVCVLYYMVYI